MKNIDVKGTIVSNDDAWIYEWFGYSATSPKMIADELEAAAGDDITLIINSGGGDVFAGNEINYLISQYKGNTTADIVGIAASIATVIACGADKVRMAAGAQYMIHNVSGSASGDYHEMDKTSQILINANRTISNTYRLKTGMSEKDLLKLMDSETWMDAVKAKSYGFIDEIIGDNGTLDNTKSTMYNVCFANIISEDVKEKIRNQIKNPEETAKPDILKEQNKIKLERMRGKLL